MMQSTLRFDPLLQPRIFEPKDQGSFASVVLSWHVVATKRALHSAVASNSGLRYSAQGHTPSQD